MNHYSFPPAGGGFRATCLDVVDGDTITVLIDLGFGHYHKTRLRLAGVNTPEANSPNLEERKAAKAASQFVTGHLIPSEQVYAPSALSQWPLRLVTEKVADKYGRYLANVFFQDEDKELHLNALLIATGHAKPYHGEKRT